MSRGVKKNPPPVQKSGTASVFVVLVEKERQKEWSIGHLFARWLTKKLT